MKYFIFIPLTLLSFFHSFAQGRGLVMDDQVYRQAPRLSPALRFSDANIPKVHSLRQYCPTAGDQGYMGSCVSWSGGYAALTISYAVKYNITSSPEVDKHAKSALFIYNQLKDRYDTKCDAGLNIENAMRFLTRNGDCEFKDFNPAACTFLPSDKIQAIASEFPIESYNTLFQIGDPFEAKITAVINSLAQNKPVVAGFIYVNSLGKAGTTGVWKPSRSETPDGGHAMCIVGYDNVNEQFEIMNSWGQSWGNKGFFKMSYRDFSDYCKYGYNLKLGYTKAELASMLKLSGNFHFKKFVRFNESTQKSEFTDVTPSLNGNYYTFRDGSVKKDDFYRIIASGMQKDSYLYIFSIKPDKSAEILFPLSASAENNKPNDVPIIPGNNVSVELPVDDARAYSTDIAGEDILCMLYSTQQIDDIKSVVANINKMPGDLMGKLQSVLGKRMVPPQNIRYDATDMSFSSTTTKGNIIPIILKVNVAP